MTLKSFPTTHDCIVDLVPIDPAQTSQVAPPERRHANNESVRAASEGWIGDLETKLLLKGAEGLKERLNRYVWVGYDCAEKLDISAELVTFP